MHAPPAVRIWGGCCLALRFTYSWALPAPSRAVPAGSRARTVARPPRNHTPCLMIIISMMTIGSNRGCTARRFGVRLRVEIMASITIKTG
jgi:hypothetical protein